MRIYPPKLPLAPTGRVFPPVKSLDYWNSARYDLNTRLSALDKTAAGITFTQLGNGDIQVDIAAGTAAHADPTDGAYILWDMKDSITGKVTRFDQAPGFYQGEFLPFLGIVSGLGANSGVELSIGHTNGTALLSVSGAGSIVDSLTIPVTNWRRLSGALSRTVDASTTGLSTSILVDYGRSLGAGSLTTGGPTTIGSTTLNPRLINPPGTPFDSAIGAGNIALQRYAFINIRCLNLIGASPLTYVIRPRILTFDWR